MKRTLAALTVTLVTMATAAATHAAVKEFPGILSLSGDTVTVSAVERLKDFDVIVYDDTKAAPPQHLGKASSFKLEPGQGFTFTFSDDTGGPYWQYISVDTKPGTGLAIDCSNKGGCKYFRPLPVAR